jgi:5-methylcytosine-specific restriction protein A
VALKPLRQCSRAGCPAYTRDGRCEKHAKEKATYDQHRLNSHQRGYDRQWSAFRGAYLAAHPLCADCEAEGRTTAAAEVHHIVKVAVDPSKKLEESNVLGLCKRHHSMRTARGE